MWRYRSDAFFPVCGTIEKMPISAPLSCKFFHKGPIRASLCLDNMVRVWLSSLNQLKPADTGYPGDHESANGGDTRCPRNPKANSDVIYAKIPLLCDFCIKMVLRSEANVFGFHFANQLLWGLCASMCLGDPSQPAWERWLGLRFGPFLYPVKNYKISWQPQHTAEIY